MGLTHTLKPNQRAAKPRATVQGRWLEEPRAQVPLLACRASRRGGRARARTRARASEPPANRPISWVPCRGCSDSCFLDAVLCPELADVQWCGQEKAKPGTLV